MILGMSVATFTLLHVLISLVAMASGAVVVTGVLGARVLGGWTLCFLVTTAATSLTGFLFHSAFGPPHAVGIISLAVLVVGIYALYSRHYEGRWRWMYVVSSVLLLYFNVFVGVVQAFQKLPDLKPYAAGPLFSLAQTLVLVAFIAVGVVAVKRFKPARAESQRAVSHDLTTLSGGRALRRETPPNS